ncbi:hypothetical protein D1O30_06070 [Methylocystis hirsuta]|uniref:Uncharacterized protein n=1 Tax=Methylocystis hirsuta TaxID=369798 RepID=A0A3M9XLR8_9HYPH|nr:hypothetical protein D1O30_06070 [Methylocystis hirsuta]
MSHQGAAKFAAALAPNVARRRRHVLMTRDGESCAASSRSEKGRGLNYSKRQSHARLAVTGASRGIGGGAEPQWGEISERLQNEVGGASQDNHAWGDGRLAEADAS